MKDSYNFHVRIKRPEEQFDRATDYYRQEILMNYAKSKNLMRIQRKITHRALELLNINKENKLILDAGCGPGFATFYLKDLGFKTVALDIINEFLKFYDLKALNPIMGDMCLSPFRSNTFDAIISISVLQWIIKNLGTKDIQGRTINLFQSLYRILKCDCSAIIQFYPKNNSILDKLKKLIIDNSGFNGEFIIDNPDNPKKRKIFLFLKKE